MTAPARDGRSYYVTVYKECRRASCWHGMFMCERYQTAGVVDVLASDLVKENREHPSYFTREELMRVCGTVQEANR